MKFIKINNDDDYRTPLYPLNWNWNSEIHYDTLTLEFRMVNQPCDTTVKIKMVRGEGFQYQLQIHPSSPSQRR